MDEPRSKFATGTDRWMVGAAIVGLVAALVFVVAPVHQDALSYTFAPASDASRFTPTGEATASLALARQYADSLELTLPCDAPGSTFASTTSSALVERAGSLQFTTLSGAMSVRISEGTVSVTRGASVLFSTDVVHSPDCVVDVSYRAGSWGLRTPSEEVGTPGDAPRVSQARFAGPAAVDERSIVVVETRELGTSPGALQLGSLAVSLLAPAVVARALIERGRGLKPQPSPASGRVASGRRVVWADVAVVSVLVLWVFLIPVNIDDGWLVAVIGGYGEHGDFSGLYTSDATVYTFGYWYMWLQHLWFGLSSNPVVMRLPVLLVGVGSWVTLRSIGRRFGLPGSGGSVWLMGAVFVGGFGAWGMTLRVEPMIAALVGLSLLFAIRFGEGTHGWTLVGWSVVVVLGISTHPAGLLVLAPVLASVPEFRRWIAKDRRAWSTLLALATAIAALFLLVWFVDSNLATKLDTVEVQRVSTSHDDSIAEELLRYRNLELTPYATPMRRITYAMLVIGIGAFLLRRRRGVGAVNLPVWSLVIGTALLTLTPSKWPWHIGGLLGLCALVVALELRRVDAARWVFMGLGAAAAFSWAWSVSLSWNAFDLRTHEWTVFDPATERVTTETGFLPFELTSLVGWSIVALVVGLLAAAVLRWRSDLNPILPPEAIVGLASVLVITMTASTLWSDTTDTDGWTFGRQNMSLLSGEWTCGLGDEVRVPVPGSLHRLRADGVSDDEADVASRAAGFSDRGGFEPSGFPPLGINTVLPLQGMDVIGSWSEAFGETATGRYQSEWLALEPADGAVLLFVMGEFRDGADAELGNAVAIQWGSAGPEGVSDAGVEQARLNGYSSDWRLVSFERPLGADRVRLLSRDDSANTRESWVASSLPLGVELGTIGSIADSTDESIVITPPLGLYFPCVEAAPFERSVIPRPGLIVQTWSSLWQTTYTGAADSDRWFRLDADLDPALRYDEIGAHTGDVNNFMFVSQEYLSGEAGLVNGEFTLLSTSR